MYLLEIAPLQNLQNLFFIDGTTQYLNVRKDITHLLPLSESYKIQGKVIVDRDPNSSAGKINVEGIKITATGQDGNTYSVLTDNTGYYILNFPQALKYTVRISNTLGENYVLKQNAYIVQFSNTKKILLDFEFIEKRREVKMQGDKLYEFKSFKEE